MIYNFTCLYIHCSNNMLIIEAFSKRTSHLLTREKPQIRFLIPNVSEGDITLLLRTGLEGTRRTE